MWYVELLAKTYNAGDQAFYDAIKHTEYLISNQLIIQPN